MSQNQNDERPQDAVEPTDESQRLEAAPKTDETQVFESMDAPAGTQVLPPSDDATQTRVLASGETGTGDAGRLEPAPASPDEPLAVFDQPTPHASEPRATPYGGYTDTGSTGYAAASYGASPYTPTSSAPAPSGAGPAPGPASGHHGTGYQSAPQAYGTPSYPSSTYQPMAWTPPPTPLVKTTPRTSTIVWGFVIVAIGIGAVSVAAGATLDVGLAMIWLLAAAGAVLVVASIVGAVRRRGRTETTAGA